MASYSTSRFEEEDSGGAMEVLTLGEEQFANDGPKEIVLDETEPPRPPHGYTVEYTQGIPRFSVSKDVDFGMVRIICDANYGRRFPGADHFRNYRRVRRHHASRVKVRDTYHDPRLPVQFSTLMLDADSKHSMEVRATCRGNIIVFDSLLFHEDDAEAVLNQSSPAHLTRLRTQYQGPTLNQRVLAEAACHAKSTVSPLPNATYTNPSKSDHNPYSSGTHRVYKYGHQPVHTIQPRFYDSIHRYFASYGVDDSMARFVRDYANYVQAVELVDWYDRVTPVFQHRLMSSAKK